jgi:hypothetical protein
MSEFKQILALIIVLKVILIFLGPAGLMLVMPANLVEKNFITLMGCQLPIFLFWSRLSARIIIGPL